MFATQIAKMKGALVTTVVGDSGIQAVKDWGADFVVDYQNEDVLNEKREASSAESSGIMDFSFSAAACFDILTSLTATSSSC